jgi:hypothetical protein
MVEKQEKQKTELARLNGELALIEEKLTSRIADGEKS